MKYKVLKKGGFFTDPVYDLYCDWDISDWGGGYVVHGFYYIPPESVREREWYCFYHDKKFRASRRDIKRYQEFVMQKAGCYMDWEHNPDHSEMLAYKVTHDIPEMYQ